MNLLYLGWLTTMVVIASIYFIVAMTNYGNAGYFGLLIGYTAGVIGNWLLTYVDSEAYYVDGFFDAIWKKFFWTHGPQLFGFILFGIYGLVLYTANFDFIAAFRITTHLFFDWIIELFVYLFK